jgi:hypothetical protein
MKKRLPIKVTEYTPAAVHIYGSDQMLAVPTVMRHDRWNDRASEEELDGARRSVLDTDKNVPEIHDLKFALRMHALMLSPKGNRLL